MAEREEEVIRALVQKICSSDGGESQLPHTPAICPEV